jgi:hypothetical protein
VHALTVKGNLRTVLVRLRQSYVLRFTSETVALLLHRAQLQIDLNHYIINPHPPIPQTRRFLKYDVKGKEG